MHCPMAKLTSFFTSLKQLTNRKKYGRYQKPKFRIYIREEEKLGIMEKIG